MASLIFFSGAGRAVDLVCCFQHGLPLGWMILPEFHVLLLGSGANIVAGTFGDDCLLHTQPLGCHVTGTICFTKVSWSVATVNASDTTFCLLHMRPLL